jgi:ligand-binding sensor domain-containing protein
LLNQRKYILTFLQVFVFWQYSIPVYCQIPVATFSFKHILDQEETLSNYINCFLKDKDGFLWIGSSNGLKRFDGKAFTVFKRSEKDTNSLIQDEVFALCEDKNERIWIGTGEGICYFDKKNNEFYRIAELNKANYVCLNIVCDDGGNIWFSIRDKGLFRFDKKKQKLENFSHNSEIKTSINHNRIVNRGLVLDPLNRGIWIITRVGLNFFDFSEKYFLNKNNNPENNEIFDLKDVSTLARDGKNIIFFDAEAYKIKYYDVEKKELSKEITFNINRSIDDGDISYIFVDKQHNLWISAWNHTAFFYNSKNQSLSQFEHDASKPNSISASFFWEGLQQDDGTIWLGTSNGISISNPEKNFFEIFDFSNLAKTLRSDEQLHLFIEDSDNKSWWFATKNDHLLHYFSENNQLEVFQIPNETAASNVYISTLLENTTTIFITTQKAFYEFDKKRKKLLKIILPKEFNTKYWISDAMMKDQSIWIFGGFDKAFVYEIATKKWKSFPISVNPSQGVSCSAVDQNGAVWIAIHAQGLAKFSTQKQSFELVKTSSNKDFRQIGYTGMKKDLNGDFWIGTYDLVRFNPSTKSFVSALNINIINSLAIDKKGRIWTTAYNDFTIFCPKNGKTIFQNIAVDKGILKWENYIYSLNDGNLISLMKDNVVLINPQKIFTEASNDKVLISKISFNNTQTLFHKDSSVVHLKYNDNVFEVFFSTLNLSKKYKYAYQIEGFNKNWISTPNNSAAFSNLDGGDYIFRVKAIDENGFQTSASLLNIHIETIFYKSKWFFYTCLSLIALLIFGFVRFRANERAKIFKLRMQSSQLEKDKTEIQYQNLINHLNPHFLFNSLTSLNSLIMTESKAASKFLQKLSLIYRYILQNKEKDMVTLEQELSFLKHYVELQKSRFDDGLQIEVGIEKEYLSYGIVPVTLQNLFENAIKHNIIEDSSPLIISVLVKNEYLIVKNNLQRKQFVETSNKQGLESLKSLYKYLSPKPIEVMETEHEFIVKIPLL